MINSSALGIIFPNMHDGNIPELVGRRTMASVPFAGRYRMIDFCLSGMANCGIQNIGVIVRQNYQSLMDHLGNGREWDLSRKRGGLVIFPPYGREGGTTYRGRIEGLNSVMAYLAHRKEELVVMSDCDIACNIDYSKLISHHREKGADVTVVYQKAEIAQGMRSDNVTYVINEQGRVSELRVNDYKSGPQNLAMNIYVVGREYLMSVVQDEIVRGHTSFEKDFLAPNLAKINVHACEFKGYTARIYNMKSYFDESMRLLKHENLARLFPEDRPIYTKVRDEASVRYAIGSVTKNSLVADGCIIEGEIENCVLFRGVRVGKGAKLKNCVIMQGTVIENNVQMENVVTDKNVTVCEGQSLRGAQNVPVFVAKGYRVM